MDFSSIIRASGPFTQALSWMYLNLSWWPAHTLTLLSSELQSVVVWWLSPAQLFETSRTAAQQAPHPPLSLRVYPNSCPVSQWFHSIISSSVAPFSSYPQSFPASGSFPMSQLFASGGQIIGASASASGLPMNIQDWFPLGLAGLISLQIKKGFNGSHSPSSFPCQFRFSSVTQSCPTPWDPMDCSTPGFPVHHQLLELAQTHVHQVSDAFQPSHPLSSPSPPIFNLSQHQGLF